jgi:hypothetical protein
MAGTPWEGFDMTERNERCDSTPPDETTLRVSAAIVHLEYVLQGRQSLEDAAVAVNGLLSAALTIEEPH